MKKLTLILTIVALTISAYCQSSDTKIVYNGNGVYMVLMDENLNILSKKPEGQDPMITYDTFFKNYYIIYRNEDGNMTSTKFTYVNTAKDGTIRMSNEGHIHTVHDNILDKGLIMFISEELINDKYYGATVIDRVVKANK